MVANAIGAVLIFVALIIFFVGLPVIAGSVDTSDGSPLENKTETIKNIYSIYDTIIAVMPFIMFGIGMGILLK